jgi:hypothetical protein
MHYTSEVAHEFYDLLHYFARLSHVFGPGEVRRRLEAFAEEAFEFLLDLRCSLVDIPKLPSLNSSFHGEATLA